MTITASTARYIAQGVVVGMAAIVALTSFAFLIPLDSVPAVTGVSILLGLSYGVSVVAWVIVVGMFNSMTVNNDNPTAQLTWLTWLNTNLIFLVLLPATVGATAMNVTAIQNTRNLLAGQIA